MKTYYTTLPTPLETLLLTSDGTALTGLYMDAHQHAPQKSTDWQQNDEVAPFAEAKQQLQEYFEGKRTTFELPLNPCGTEFQQRVWQELRAIPFGETRSYGELARRIGNPNASRAVGLANGRNPLSIIVPCHRVIGANGKLTGYAGGMERKEWLLNFERYAGHGEVQISLLPLTVG
jgi:methylated-DNA-[protein]-cysteine S-methyltransferase